MKIKSSILAGICNLRSLALVASCVTVVAASTSCSTTRGFGQDVEKTGDKIQAAATH